MVNEFPTIPWARYANDKSFWDIANMFNLQIQGWINYYTHFYKSEIYDALRYLNGCLVKLVRRKYKKRRARRRAEHWLGEIANETETCLHTVCLEYCHQLDNGNCMSGEVHVRWCYSELGKSSVKSLR